MVFFLLLMRYALYAQKRPAVSMKKFRQTAGHFICINENRTNRSPVKRGIEGIEILRVQAVGGQAERFAEALVMHHFAGAEKSD